MSSSNVECSKCKLVVNELLTFVQNKLKTMDSETLVGVCSTVFSIDDIEKAMSFLHKVSTESIRVNKEENYELHYIIETIKSLDPEKGPIFVARDLKKLPIAAASNYVLKENYSLESENKLLKSIMATVDRLLLEVAKIASGRKVYIAKYDYEGTDKDEVSFRKGDLISNVSRIDEGWMSGNVLRTGRHGMLPAPYVALIGLPSEVLTFDFLDL